MSSILITLKFLKNIKEFISSNKKPHLLQYLVKYSGIEQNSSHSLGQFIPEVGNYI